MTAGFFRLSYEGYLDMEYCQKLDLESAKLFFLLGMFLEVKHYFEVWKNFHRRNSFI